MPVEDSIRAQLADTLYEAYTTGRPIPPLREDHDLTVEDGYAIQAQVIDRRRADEGKATGYKVGFTTPAIQDTVGIDEPAYGQILSDTVITRGPVDLDGLIDPRVETEIAFLLDDSLEDASTPVEVLAATKAVVPVIEIVDSRIRDWDVTAPEAIADNALSGRVVLGDRLDDAAGVDLALEGVQVLRNGATAATGIGADVLGHPTNSITWLATSLQEAGAGLEAGDLVLSGSITPLVPIDSGDVIEARFSSLGSITICGG